MFFIFLLKFCVCKNHLLETAYMKVKPDTVMAVCYKTIAHGYRGRYDIYLHRIVFMQHTLFEGKI